MNLRERWPFSLFTWGNLWNSEKGEQLPGPTSVGTSTGRSVTDEKAMSIAAVFRCIRILSETCSGLPLRAYSGTPTGDRKLLPDSHWLPTLLREPNETMTGDELVEAWVGQMAGWGNAYSQIVPNALGRPVELWPYKVDNMRVFRNEDRTLRYEYPDPKGGIMNLPASRTLHMRAFCLDGVMGLSPLGLARNSMAMAVSAQDYAGSFFSSGGRPSGVMTSDKLLTDKQREQVRKEFGGLADGGDGKRFWLMEASMKYTPITVSPEDMQMLQTRSFEIKEIARFFGVPLFLLMETEGQTSWGTGLEQNNNAFLLYALRPYLSRIQATINRFIIPAAERTKVFVEFDESPLMWADTAAQGTFLSTLTNNGLMTRNEGRARLKLPAMDDANELTVQTALTPLGKLGMEPNTANSGGFGADPEDKGEDTPDPAVAKIGADLAEIKAKLSTPQPQMHSPPRLRVVRVEHIKDAHGQTVASIPHYEQSL